MHLNRQTARLLHGEHMEEVALLERLEDLLRRQRADRPPAPGNADLDALLPDLISRVDGRARQHFDFEEAYLFPKLAELGESDIGDFLKSEHDAIRATGRGLADLAGAAREAGFGAESWRAFHQLAGELVERAVSHIQKEEMGLLPMLEDLLEEEEDAELALAYAERN